MLSTIQLRLAPAPVRSVAAWFLPGAEADEWLEEISRSGLGLRETRLLVIPNCVADRTPAGLLIIPPPGAVPTRSPRGMACGVLTDRLYLPVDAELLPTMDNEELKQLCPLEVYFFHPTLGLSGFERESTLRVADLLKAPAAAAENWNCAQLPTVQPCALQHIVVGNEPSVDQIFGEESKDIGSEPDAALPPAPNEPKESGWDKAGRGARKFFGQQLSNLLRKLPHIGAGRNWLNKLEDWANRQVQHVSEELERLRSKELQRLLHMLETNPEAGLRHAIPLNDFAHRGRGPAGGKLVPHNLHFDPEQIGGGPADFWSITPNLQAELTRRYRQLADRELSLGRYRRAAYIYAELLGDLASAANALKQGRHYREAATLYEERLHNPIAAAQCLAEGGLLREALERYEKLGLYLEVADLCERLGDHAGAVTALRQVVSQRIATGDTVGAAQLLESRLQATEEALALLEGAWPKSRQAIQCLAHQLDMLARLGRHDSALERLARLRRDDLYVSYAEPVAALLANSAQNYPDERVRGSAADVVRVIVGTRLSQPSIATAEASQLVRSLCRLEPNDRLLVRDGNRYVAQGRELEQQSPYPGAQSFRVVNRPKVVATFELPQALEWLQVCADDPWFFAAGGNKEYLTLLRGTWAGEFQSLSWPCSVSAAKQGLIVEPIQEWNRRRVLISVAGFPPFKEQCFPPDLFISRGCSAGTPSWLLPQLHPFTVADSNVWSVHLAAGKAVLSCYDSNGSLLRTEDISVELLSGAERSGSTRLCIAGLARGPLLALGNRMLVWQEAVTQIELGGQVTRLVPTLRHTRAGTAILYDRGASMYWHAADTLLNLDNDTQWTGAAWTPSGKLVLVSAKEGCLIDVDSRGVSAVEKFAWHGLPPVAVTAAGDPNQFAIFTAHGRVSVFSIPNK